MLNTLQDYISNSVPELLETAAGLGEKANDAGQLLPFPGNTVVFLLDDDTKQKLHALQDDLYACCGDLLAEPLSPDTFHMTLHDLANGPLLPQREEMASQAKAILDALRSSPAAPIAMKATWSFNMVNTSIVLGLEPAFENDWHRLDRLYMQFQQVRNLPYALTPHITLAYFRPGRYTEAQTRRLRRTLRPAALDVQLEMRNLVLQDFDHMNAYKTVY